MIFAIIGPTASKKSKLAYEMSTILNADIINFDAFQIYKELNIGSAKPSKEELKDPRFKLYDYVSIDDDYDVASFQKDIRKLLDDKHNHILVGGTGLYLKAALFDYKFLEEEKMPDDFLCDLTNQELYEMLYKIDEEDALKIGNNNRKRLLRALYIFKLHGKNKTELNDNGKDNLLYKNTIFIGLNPDRNELYKDIDLRVDVMFLNGLKNEAIELINTHDNKKKGLQAIGYKEFMLDLDDSLTKELIKKNTRNYAKRQMTFFRHQFNDVLWFSNYENALKYIMEHKNEY